MADLRSLRASICSISRDDFTALSGSDLHFNEGIIPEVRGDFVFGEEIGRRFALALRITPHNVPPQRDLLLNACVCKETATTEKHRSTAGELKIVLLEDFVQNHGLHSGQVVWVRRVDPIPLQTVFVGISSKEGFLWAQKSLASFLSANLLNGPIAVRQNDTVFLSFDQSNDGVDEKRCRQLHILQCQPVLQGSFTAETSIVISEIKIPQIPLVPEAVETKSVTCPTESLETFLISDFTRNIPRMQSGQEWSYATALDKSFLLEVRTLNCRQLMGLDATCDESGRVYVHSGTLLDMLVFNKSWVQISTKKTDTTKDQKGDLDENSVPANLEEQSVCQSQGKFETISNRCYAGEASCTNGENNQENSGYRIVQIFAANVENRSNRASRASKDSMRKKTEIQSKTFGGQIEKGVVYLTPLLYFNLFGRNNVGDISPKAVYVIPFCEHTDIPSRESIRTTKSRSKRPPFAKEAHVAVVQSPSYKVRDSFDGALASHFKIPRLLTVGDVFYVQYSCLEDIEGMGSSAVEEQGLRNMPVYFQVTRLVCQDVEAKSCFVDIEHSSLYQRGSVHTYVPSALEDSVCHAGLSDGSRPSYWQQTTRPGLNSCILAIENIVKPYLSSRSVSSLPPSAILLTGPPGSGKKTVVMATSRRLSLHTLGVRCYDLIGESVAATEARIRNTFQKAVSCSPCVLLLQDIQALGKDREGSNDEPRLATTMLDCINSLQEESDWPVVVIATSSSPNDITADIFSCFLHEVKLEAPTEEERFEMLCGLAEMACVGSDVSFKQLAKRTAGMVLGDFVAMFNYASSAAAKHLLDGSSERKRGVMDLKEGLSTQASSDDWFPWKLEQDLSQMGVFLCWQDFEDSLEILQSSMSDAIGAPKIPSVKWEDVGGLAEVKAEILDTVQLPLQHPELFAAGLRRSGVLLYGPPGTGKTLLAKAVATECSLNFLSVKGPELINMYVGQSEQNVREVFARAQSARPCVIFFDELDSLAPNRGRSGDSGGVMDRVVSQLLAELDGLHKACDVFVIGATNRPDLLDPALLRPGRFDKLLYLGVSDDRESQINILKALTRKFSLAPDLQLEDVAALCPGNLTGADFYALCSDAMLQAVKKKIELLEAEFVSLMKDCSEQQYREILMTLFLLLGLLDCEDDGVAQSEIQVTERDFQTALDKLVPSVSLHELKRYQDLQKEFTNSGLSS